MGVDADTSKVKLEDNYDEKILNINKISNPLASKKLAKKIYKLIKKASKERTKNIINGLKDVQTRIRKGERGIAIFAGDVYPLDIVCHLPAVCEEKDIQYCYTPSRQDLGTAMGVKRGSIVLMIRENPDYKELFDEVKEEIKKLPTPF
ncbi:H/ACA ribonucleoprotein complex subunit 2-like protein [Chironomus tepperi]|uniref:H/ACA ribonucleoprotein complex subunit 2-like protein n=1 Tax=Chironomus tepperi TaxID=113505 RepID=UPI00391F4CFC